MERGLTLKEHREATGATLDECADYLELESDTVYEWEMGYRSVPSGHIDKLMGFYDITAGQLLAMISETLSQYIKKTDSL